VTVNGMKPSETMQVTGGLVAVLSFASKSEKGAKKFFIIELQREGRSWHGWHRDPMEGGRREWLRIGNQESCLRSWDL
jgi:hypothetical protein